jgi:hypothetical protein
MNQSQRFSSIKIPFDLAVFRLAPDSPRNQTVLNFAPESS